jgi:hypothetical protein
MTPEILSLALDNDIHLVTFPAPYYSSSAATGYWCLKTTERKWRKQLVKFMNENPGGKPDRYDFSRLSAVAYRDVFI